MMKAASSDWSGLHEYSIHPKFHSNFLELNRLHACFKSTVRVGHEFIYALQNVIYLVLALIKLFQITESGLLLIMCFLIEITKKECFYALG